MPKTKNQRNKKAVAKKERDPTIPKRKWVRRNIPKPYPSRRVPTRQSINEENRILEESLSWANDDMVPPIDVSEIEKKNSRGRKRKIEDPMEQQLEIMQRCEEIKKEARKREELEEQRENENRRAQSELLRNLQRQQSGSRGIPEEKDDVEVKKTEEMKVEQNLPAQSRSIGCCIKSQGVVIPEEVVTIRAESSAEVNLEKDVKMKEAKSGAEDMQKVKIIKESKEDVPARKIFFSFKINKKAQTWNDLLIIEDFKGPVDYVDETSLYVMKDPVRQTWKTKFEKYIVEIDHTPEEPPFGLLAVRSRNKKFFENVLNWFLFLKYTQQ